MTSMILEYNSIEDLTYNESDGHYHLHVPIFREHDTYSNIGVDFVFDTGAFLTVLTQDSATRLGFTNCFTIQKDIQLSGFAGGCLADLKEVPGFVIGGRKLEGVKVAVPHINTDANILGLNVIENFKYFIDTEHDKIYFDENPKPEIPELLRAKKIYVVSSNQI